MTNLEKPNNWQDEFDKNFKDDNHDMLVDYIDGKMLTATQIKKFIFNEIEKAKSDGIIDGAMDANYATTEVYEEKINKIKADKAGEIKRIWYQKGYEEGKKESLMSLDSKVLDNFKSSEYVEEMQSKAYQKGVSDGKREILESMPIDYAKTWDFGVGFVLIKQEELIAWKTNQLEQLKGKR